jgi:integrase
MPVYRVQKNRWRVRVWFKGRRQDWIVHGTKNDAEAFEARKRLEAEQRDPGEIRTAPTFFDFSMSRYKTFGKSHLRATTWSARRYQLATLIAFFGVMKLTAINTTDIERYKAKRIEDGVKPISINNELAVLQAVLSFARHVGVPVPKLEFKMLPVRDKARLLVWSTEDVERLLLKCEELSPEIGPLVMFISNTGCRRGEALALLWTSVDLERRMVRIEPSAEWQPKSGRAREVPISDELHAVLVALPRASRFVFPSPRTGDRYQFWPKRQFDRARAAAGLTGGPHTLRHTFASHFLKHEPDIFLLARVLGHTDARVTRLYSHLLPEHLARARNAVRFGSPAKPAKLGGLSGAAGAAEPPPAHETAREAAARRWKVPEREISVPSTADTADRGQTVPGTVPGRPRRGS